MRAQIGSIWRRTDLNEGGMTYRVDGFDAQDRIQLVPVDYPASGEYAIHPTTFHQCYTLVKEAPSDKVQVGQIWTSKVNGRSYRVESVSSGGRTVRIVSLHTSQATGRPFTYSYTLDRFLRTCRLSEDQTQTTPTPQRWAEVERTLRAYTAANREQKRLETRLERLQQGVVDARNALEDHRRNVVHKASAEYGEALRRMEESAK